RKPIVQRQPGRTKRIVQKHQRRPFAAAKKLHVSSAHADNFFLTTAHCESAFRICSVCLGRHSRENGNPGLFFSVSHQTWLLTFAGMTRSGLYLHAVTTGASTLIGRTFGIAFSANRRMLFSVYSRGALPTEKFAINRPKPTLLA